MKKITENNRGIGRKKLVSFFCSKIYYILICACILSYFSGVNGSFVFDDKLIKNDKFFSPESNSLGFLKCWQRPYWGEKKSQGLYRPLTLFSFWFNSRICGLNSPGFRIVNLILQIIISMLIFKLGRVLRLPRVVAGLAALLFAVHPIHTEAVVPAFGRSELLCALFLITGLIFHCKSEKNYVTGLASAICFLLSAWSKEHGLVFLPLCVICDLYFKRINLKKIKHFTDVKAQYSYIFYLLVFVLVFSTRYYGTGEIIPRLKNFSSVMDNRLAGASISERIITASKIQVMALLKFLWPETLSHDYSYAQIIPSTDIFNWYFFLLLLVLMGIIVFLYVNPALKKRIIFLFCCFLISILPASNFILVSGTIFAERLYYIPSIWLCFIMAIIISKCAGKIPFKFATAIIILLVFALAIRSNLRCNDWKNSEILAYAGVFTSPKSAKMWNNLAVEFGNKGKFGPAIAACNRALTIYPEYHVALANRALYNAQSGNTKAAEEDFKKAFKIDSKSDYICFNYGSFLANNGRLEDARKIWEYSLTNNPHQPELKKNLKILYNNLRIKSSLKNASENKE